MRDYIGCHSWDGMHINFDDPKPTFPSLTPEQTRWFRVVNNLVIGEAVKADGWTIYREDSNRYQVNGETFASRGHKNANTVLRIVEHIISHHSKSEAA